MNIYNKISNGVLIFLTYTFLLLSCSNEAGDPIKKEALAEILAELMIIESLVVSDSIKAVKSFKIMQNKNINIDSLKNIISKFEKRPEFWQSIYDNIKNQLKESPKRVPSNK